ENQTNVTYSTPNVVGNTYAWSITGGTITAGAGTSSITVTWGAAGTGTLQLTETITASTCAVTTAVYNITKNANPTPVISGPATVCAAQAANVYSTTNVVGNSYNWTVSGGTITAGAGTNSITVTWGSGASGTVRLTETVTATGCATTTPAYVVTINPNPVVNAIADQIACNGTTVAAISLSASTGGGETFNWIDGAPIGMPNGSDNSAPFDIPSFTATNAGNAPVTIPIKVTATKNSCTGPILTFNVTVNPSPTFGITNLTPVICEGTANNITLTSPTANAVITLISATYSGATGGTYLGGETFTTGQKINETLGNPTESPITVTYRFSVSANGCTDPVQQSTTVTINPAPPVFSITNITPSICTGTATNITLITPTLNALVRLDAVSYGAATGSTLVVGSTYTTGQAITQTLTNLTNAPTTVTYTFSVSANGCNNPVQQQTTVVVNPSPTMSINNITASICSGTAVNITLNSPTSGAIMRLTSVNYNGATGTLIAPQNYTPGSVITESLTNPTNNPIIVTYNFDVSANGCSTAGPFTTTVTVKPSPVFTITNASPQVCEGTQTDITLNTPTAGGQVRLDAVNYNGATGTLSAGALFTNGQKITEVLVNPTNFPITVTYTFSVSANACGNPIQQQTTVTITRSPTVTVPSDYTTCQPTTIPLTGTIGASAASGLWSIVSGGGTLSATNVSGTTVTANYTVAPGDIGSTVTLRLTTNDPDGPGPCGPAFDDINITINRAASITAGIDLAQCRDQASIALQGAITYAPNGVSWSGGTGTFGTATSPTSTYSFNNPSEVNTNVTLTLTANDPDGAGPTGPCGIVTDQMILRVNQLPTVVFSGFGPGSPPQIAENATPITLTGNQSGGTFTILPITSSIGSTTHSPVDEVSFDPSAVDLGANFVKYTYTDANGCTNFQQQQVIVNPVTDIDFTLQYASGPLSGQFIPSNGTGGFDFCGEVGNVRIVGNPVASSGINPTNFTAVGANAAILNAKISQIGPDYFIDTNGLPSDNYLLQYTYTNSLGVTSAPLIRPLKIYASPIATIDNLTNNCIASSILFKDASTLPPTPFPNNPATWSYRWDFGDGQFGTLKNQPHPYSASGVYNVQLTVTTGPTQSCSGSTSLVIRVGDVPVVDFAWSAICTNDNTKFQDETDPGSVSTIDNYAWDFGDGFTLSGPPAGIIPPGTHGGSTFGTYDKPEHNYSTPGSKNVVLSVTTNDGCNNSKPKTISILVSGSTVTPDAITPYSNNFEVADSEWIPEGFEISTNPDVFSNASWQFGVPTGIVINPTVDPTTTSAWWTGANSNSYYASEESAVNGPCFDLRSLSRPMVTLDYWSDAEQNLDGAALQYSTDGGLNWSIVGPLASSPNEGINWYAGQTVQSNPGRQPFGSNGWTGKLSNWKNGRFNLDMIPQAERDQVRLRVAFSSNNTNDPSKTFDGFAFDNVFIGERRRNVMVEYFTNAGINASTNTYFDNLYSAQFTGPLPKDSSDFFKIQYHIANPSDDPINQDNPIDPAARSLFYGISQPPSAIMDGILGNYYGTTFNGNYLSITEEQLERRALEDPLFDIKLDTLAATSTTIKFHAEFTYKHPTLAFSTPVTVHVALVEDNVGSPPQRNVLRKFMLGTEGVTLNLPWTFNHTEVIDRDLEIDAPIGTNNSNLYLIAFIQDKRFDSKIIHQAIKIKLSKKTQAIITGTDDPIFEQVKNMAVYPNPATRYVNFATEAPLTRDYQYSIIDQRGITVMSGNLNRDLTIPQQVEISNIADGVYVVLISQNGRRLTQRKLAVLKR
ncbi:MAG TPA: PKD domain-containing protein, partial [Cyclobacteriaceae bacterium]|nr:PKD domain-containing protein [Cyclobacteriaceae bacterium]HNE97945.1 PKD domain-containing protein [Cyclobacteriaceae bacterium]HNH60760.1 PKD domain-containing protein [Cyclobacteriaceae bacterium]HNK26296.1 PKD domain-containing protein [Cyclobacteriaceae bacterium]HNL45864.1 PKD domain-containing protein [Cyclobacteriaceae bacterium]